MAVGLGLSEQEQVQLLEQVNDSFWVMRVIGTRQEVICWVYFCSHRYPKDILPSRMTTTVFRVEHTSASQCIFLIPVFLMSL